MLLTLPGRVLRTFEVKGRSFAAFYGLHPDQDQHALKMNLGSGSKIG